jgi:phosphatidylserine/phosphatidylglycerophosphate/cardiolipin synthase-like enzyme
MEAEEGDPYPNGWPSTDISAKPTLKKDPQEKKIESKETIAEADSLGMKKIEE